MLAGRLSALMIPRLEAARLMVTVPERGLQIAHVDLKLVHHAFEVHSAALSLSGTLAPAQVLALAVRRLARPGSPSTALSPPDMNASSLPLAAGSAARFCSCDRRSTRVSARK